LETTYLKQLPFMAGNRPPSVVLVVSVLKRMDEKNMRPRGPQIDKVP
jgi:hypothetical protein